MFLGRVLSFIWSVCAWHYSRRIAILTIFLKTKKLERDGVTLGRLDLMIHSTAGYDDPRVGTEAHTGAF